MISSYDFKYMGIMKNAMQSIPIGNGDLGANIWADSDGLWLLLSKTDAWSELNRLLKTGLLKLSLNPSPFNNETKWHLSYEEGILYIKSDDNEISLYADANFPCYYINYKGKTPRDVKLEAVNYRNHEIKFNENDSSNYFMMAPESIYKSVESADCVFSADDESIGQYHYNDTSCYEFSLEYQSLGNFEQKNDPFIDLTFGYLAKSKQLKINNGSLYGSSISEFTIKIISHTGKFKNPEDWIKKSCEIMNQPDSDILAHKEYWKNIWQRSYIEITGDDDARCLTEAYTAQRYMMICAGSGKYPIKFNGSIFTNQPSPFEESCDNYDYRAWGGPYWFQNTRLVYWSMLYSGDYKQMKPLFDMYFDALPLAKYRTKTYFAHDGAYFPETMSSFGIYALSNYGVNREGKLAGYIENRYIRYYFVGALELCKMMMEYTEHTEDMDFLKEKFFPFALEILIFFREHFETIDGKLFIHPTEALETWQDCVNDTPTIAGLSAVTENLLKYDNLPEKLENICREIREILPDIPVDKKNGTSVIMPYHINMDSRRNVENPELYTVFPFDIYRIGKNNLPLARETYFMRDIKSSCGWQQHGIQAARLGLTAEAEKEALNNSRNTNPNCIYTAFWGPNYDWLPDQDNGANLMLTLTNMLVQADSDTIRLFPAWNKSRNVKFRLPEGNHVMKFELINIDEWDRKNTILII